jgi:hypothetical protein
MRSMLSSGIAAKSVADVVTPFVFRPSHEHQRALAVAGAVVVAAEVEHLVLRALRRPDEKKPVCFWITSTTLAAPLSLIC